MTDRAPVEEAVLESLKAARILMVDDEPTTLDVLEMFLEADGYLEIVKLCDPGKALETVVRMDPDIVLLNLMMPEVSGLDVLEAMRANEAVRDIPVVIITGSGDPEQKRKALEAGASDFLGKPVDPSELTLRVRNLLATRPFREGAEFVPSKPSASDGPLSEERVRRIVETFLDRLRPRLDEMDAALACQDFVTLAELAHWLKGSAGTVGIHDFTEPAESLEESARVQDALGCGTAMRTLRQRLERVDGRQESTPC